MIWAGGALSLFISGSGSQFERLPVERPDSTTAQFVHPADVLFIGGGPTDVDVQLAARTVFKGEEDQAPDAGQWLGVPFKP